MVDISKNNDPGISTRNWVGWGLTSCTNSNTGLVNPAPVDEEFTIGVSGTQVTLIRKNLPTKSAGIMNWTVDWGDGRVSSVLPASVGQITHTYEAKYATWSMPLVIHLSDQFHNIQVDSLVVVLGETTPGTERTAVPDDWISQPSVCVQSGSIQGIPKSLANSTLTFKRDGTWRFTWDFGSQETGTLRMTMGEKGQGFLLSKIQAGQDWCPNKKIRTTIGDEYTIQYQVVDSTQYVEVGPTDNNGYVLRAREGTYSLVNGASNPVPLSSSRILDLVIEDSIANHDIPVDAFACNTIAVRAQYQVKVTLTHVKSSLVVEDQIALLAVELIWRIPHQNP
jgi:hypothetical protein